MQRFFIRRNLREITFLKTIKNLWFFSESFRGDVVTGSGYYRRFWDFRFWVDLDQFGRPEPPLVDVGRDVLVPACAVVIEITAYSNLLRRLWNRKYKTGSIETEVVTKPSPDHSKCSSHEHQSKKAFLAISLDSAVQLSTWNNSTSLWRSQTSKMLNTTKLIL